VKLEELQIVLAKKAFSGKEKGRRIGSDELERNSPGSNASLNASPEGRTASVRQGGGLFKDARSASRYNHGAHQPCASQ